MTSWVNDFPVFRIASDFVFRIAALSIVAVLHLFALKVLLLESPFLVPAVTGTVHSIRVLTNDHTSSEIPLSPPLMSFKKPMPVIWRPQIEMVDTEVTQIPQPMVIIGARLNPEFANDFPHTAYPRESRNASEEGEVVLSLQILEDGRVGDVLLDKNSGYDSLDEAAITYVKKYWRFIPALRDGVAVTDWKTVSIDFRLAKIEVRW